MCMGDTSGAGNCCVLQEVWIKSKGFEPPATLSFVNLEEPDMALTLEKDYKRWCLWEGPELNRPPSTFQGSVNGTNGKKEIM